MCGGGGGDTIFLKILMSNNFVICQVFRLPSFERLFTFLKRNIGDKLIKSFMNGLKYSLIGA